MKKIYQTIIDKKIGNCMQAAIASLFDKELDEVPNFILESEDKWFNSMYNFMKENGCNYNGTLHNKNYSTLWHPTQNCFKETKWHRPSIMTKKALYKHNGVNGLFYAGVLSPKFFSWQEPATHAVIIDRDYNVVHDPSPAYQKILGYPLENILRYNGIVDVMLINSNN